MFVSWLLVIIPERNLWPIKKEIIFNQWHRKSAIFAKTKSQKLITKIQLPFRGI